MRFIQRKYETIPIPQDAKAILATEYFEKVTLPEAIRDHVVYIIEGKAFIVKPSTK